MADDLFKKIMVQEKESLEFGFYWENIEQLLEQVKSECDEVSEAYLKNDHKHLKEEIGDLINATISLSIFCNIDPKEVLIESIEKYQKRFDTLVELVKKDGLENLKNKSMEVLMSYWFKAKKTTAAKS